MAAIKEGDKIFWHSEIERLLAAKWMAQFLSNRSLFEAALQRVEIFCCCIAELCFFDDACACQKFQ